jgi:hypothetical protein
MRVFKTKPFERFARKEAIADENLCEAVVRADAGLIDADLGGGVIKQRVARKGGGRSGGYRTVIAYRSGVRSIFDNLNARELQSAANVFLSFGESELDEAVDEKRLIEVECDVEEVPQ